MYRLVFYFCVLQIVFISIFHNEAVFAQSIMSNSSGFQSWDAIILEGPIKEKGRGYLFIQPRIGTTSDFIVVRPAYGHVLNKEFSLWQGVSWQPLVSPQFIDEVRLYQDLLCKKEFKKFKLTLRNRTEERFIQGVGGASIRQRERLNFYIPFGESGKWGFIASQEILINYDSRQNGPRGGFGQARLYYGLTRKINDRLKINFGYMLNLIGNSQPFLEDFTRNILMINININTDGVQVAE